MHTHNIAQTGQRQCHSKIHSKASTKGKQNPAADNTAFRTALKPDFGHRLSPFPNVIGFTDTIERMAVMSCSVLTLLKSQFSDEDGGGDSETIYYALESVNADVSDIQAVVSAFRAAMNKIGPPFIGATTFTLLDAIAHKAFMINGVLAGVIKSVGNP
ncbi:MAG: hypothetical protein Q7U57_12870 [Methylovulum sp.]|nr:hypothetical protein [Methylovulum sp.]